jgi:hypothetical protein
MLDRVWLAMQSGFMMKPGGRGSGGVEGGETLPGRKATTCI